MKHIIFPVFLVAAGNIWGQAGANSIALGGNTANPDAGISLANNPAYFENHKWVLGTWGQNRFAGTKLANGGIAGHVLLKHTAFGLSANYQGSSWFHRSEILLHGGQHFSDNFSAGFSIGYASVAQGAGYGKTGQISGKLALYARIGKKADASFTVSNPWVVQNEFQTAFPRADLAVGYPFGKATKVYAQFRSQPKTHAIYGLAIVHKVQGKIAFRAALQSGFEPISAGLEWTHKTLCFSMATTYHTYLGFTPVFAFIWKK